MKNRFTSALRVFLSIVSAIAGTAFAGEDLKKFGEGQFKFLEESGVGQVEIIHAGRYRLRRETLVVDADKSLNDLLLQVNAPGCGAEGSLRLSDDLRKHFPLLSYSKMEQSGYEYSLRCCNSINLLMMLMPKSSQEIRGYSLVQRWKERIGMEMTGMLTVSLHEPTLSLLSSLDYRVVEVILPPGYPIFLVSEELVDLAVNSSNESFRWKEDFKPLKNVTFFAPGFVLDGANTIVPVRYEKLSSGTNGISVYKANGARVFDSSGSLHDYDKSYTESVCKSVGESFNSSNTEAPNLFDILSHYSYIGNIAYELRGSFQRMDMIENFYNQKILREICERALGFWKVPGQRSEL